MFFSKLFGSRKQVASGKTSAAPAVPRKPVDPTAFKAIPPEKKKTGFDPYNSGAFRRSDAWERVPRR
jgi:hypothetical protein